jgi:hypothetical protein
LPAVPVPIEHERVKVDRSIAVALENKPSQ